MISAGWIYFEVGLKHVLNVTAYDHLLFLVALAAPQSFKEWKRMLLLVTAFAIGHTLTLFLSLLNLFKFDEAPVTLAILVTILFTALGNFASVRKTSRKSGLTLSMVITLFFGLIHGLGFSHYFNTLLPGSASEKIMPLLQFTLGIEVSQILVVLAVLNLSYAVQSWFKVSKRDFVLVVSAFITGVLVPMIMDNEIWKNI